MKVKDIDPIKASEKAEWNKIIAQSKKIVTNRDKCVFDLILLAGKVEAQYGQNRIGMWADEIGVSWSQAKQWRWLANKGMDQEFINTWAKTPKNPDGLSYSVIREISMFCASIKSEVALAYFEWAKEHKATVISIRAYMTELAAPHRKAEMADKAYKVALRDKQQNEGFSDFVRLKLEEIIEEHPQAEEALIKTSIVGQDDLEQLKIAAGVVTAEEERILQEAKKLIRKVKNMREFLASNRRKITDSISLAHIHSDDLKDALNYLSQECALLGETEIPESDSEEFQEVNVA